MWKLDYKERWEPKNQCFWTVVLEKTLESPLDCKEIPPVNPKGNQSWIFIGRTDAEAETPIFCPLDVKSSFEKILMLGKIEGGRRRGQQKMRWLDGIIDSWVWVNSRSWWWTGRPALLQSMGSQRVRHNWATELNYISIITLSCVQENLVLSLCRSNSFFFLFHYVVWTLLLDLELSKWQTKSLFKYTILSF